MHESIRNAVAHAYGFRGWTYSNVAEFKHELFHRLAQVSVDGHRLIDKVPGTPSCRLHCEGKVENGNASKADLLICDPTRRQRFSYAVDYVLELTSKAAKQELDKFQGYQNAYKGFFLASEQPTGVSVPSPTIGTMPVAARQSR